MYYVPLEDSEKHKVEYEVSGEPAGQERFDLGAGLQQSSFDLGVADPVVGFSWFLVDVNPGASARGQPGPKVHQLRRGPRSLHSQLQSSFYPDLFLLQGELLFLWLLLGLSFRSGPRWGDFSTIYLELLIWIRFEYCCNFVACGLIA
jgi:hypothetical protein